MSKRNLASTKTTKINPFLALLFKNNFKQINDSVLFSIRGINRKKWQVHFHSMQYFGSNKESDLINVPCEVKSTKLILKCIIELSCLIWQLTFESCLFLLWTCELYIRACVVWVCVCPYLCAVVQAFCFSHQVLSSLLTYRVLNFPSEACVFVLQMSLSMRAGRAPQQQAGTWRQGHHELPKKNNP